LTELTGVLGEAGLTAIWRPQYSSSSWPGSGRVGKFAMVAEKP
jgi:hypothetical protein